MPRLTDAEMALEEDLGLDDDLGLGPVWDHPHRRVVRIQGSRQFVCLDCGTQYDPDASGADGDPKEWEIPAVTTMRRMLRWVMR